MMEITLREIIASIAIIAVMLILGVVISNKISDSVSDDIAEYNKALQINNNQETFEYGMRTNVGNAFVYGELKPVDSVSFSEIKGKYLSITKIKEEYTRHENTVTKTDANGKTYTTIEVTYNWDEVHRESKHSKEVTFLGVKFPYDKFNIPSGDYITTIDEDSDTRYCYYGVNPSIKGTIYVQLKNNDIKNNDFGSINITTKSLKETYEFYTSDYSVIAFWMFWIIIIGLLVYGFYYLDNNWLNFD